MFAFIAPKKSQIVCYNQSSLSMKLTEEEDGTISLSPAFLLDWKKKCEGEGRRELEY